MNSVFVVQAYKAKGTRLVGQASTVIDDPNDATVEGPASPPWRAGLVVLGREVDEDGIHRGSLFVLVIRGRVPEGRFATKEVAA